MDINITSPLIATVSLMQNQNSLLEFLKYVALYGATGFAALLGVYLQGRSAQNLEKEKTKNLKIQKQLEIFSKLNGIQSVLSQDYLSQYQNNVSAISQEVAARFHTDDENQKLHIEEARTLLIRSSENTRLFAKDRRELYEIIGSILIFFPNKQELRNKIDPIYSQLAAFESEFNKGKMMKELDVLFPGIFGDIKKCGEVFNPDKADGYFRELEIWKANKHSKINTLTVEIVLQQLEDLLNYLHGEISSVED